MFETALIGLESTELTEWERSVLKERTPRGVILFARNIESEAQIRRLLDDVRECGGEELWAAIDEEGGRVNRIPWAPFNNRVQAAEYGRMFTQDSAGAMKAVFDDAYTVGTSLKELGFTHDCSPVLDIFHPDGDAIIGDRAYSDNVSVVAALAAANLHGLQAAGIEGVGKHFPGHGRANGDSHLMLPTADAPLDVLLTEAEGFNLLFAQELKHVMTAHVVYPQADKEAATFSTFWLQDILKNRFGFTGHVWSDDLCMKGAGDDIRGAAERALAAGCDTLLVCFPEGVKEFYQT